MCSRLKRSLPYIYSLQKGLKSNSDKVALLRRFPDFVLKDIIEILLNIVNKNCRTTSTRQIVKHQKAISKFLDKAKKHKRGPVKKLLNNQKGEFLGAILPTILGFINSII
jgi:hypothetical protein